MAIAGCGQTLCNATRRDHTYPLPPINSSLWVAVGYARNSARFLGRWGGRPISLRPTAAQLGQTCATVEIPPEEAGKHRSTMQWA